MSITLRRPSTAECKGVKAEDTRDMIRRISTSVEGPGTVMGPWDVVRDANLIPGEIEEDTIEGQGERTQASQLKRKTERQTFKFSAKSLD